MHRSVRCIISQRNHHDGGSLSYKLIYNFKSSNVRQMELVVKRLRFVDTEFRGVRFQVKCSG